ncbi:MAG: DNA polymerase III subunit delta [Woeseiaceae bacterium]
MRIKAGQLAAALKNDLAPCYLVSGDEHLLVAEATDAIRRAARDRDFTERDLYIATSGFDWEQLRTSGSNLSLFAEKRIVELRLPTGKPGVTGARVIADLAENAGSDLLLIVSAPKLEGGGRTASWVKAIESRGAHIAVWPVEARELPGWIANRMRHAGLEPDRAAVALVADRVEGNLLAAGQEIEKLRLLLGEGRVTADDVAAAVADSSRFDIFKLTDAALSGDAARTLRILSGLRAEGSEPVMVVWAVARELRTLAGLADTVADGTQLGAAMQKMRIWRNRQDQIRRCIGRHQRQDFRRLLRAAGFADQAAKGQNGADPWQVLTEIVLSLASPSRSAA